MNLEAFVSTYGYPALLAGCLLEGETIVITAGFLAHRGYLFLPWVILIAFAGAFAADQFFFRVGRNRGEAFLATRPQWLARVDQVRCFLVRYQVLAILGYRFIYGMRTVTPVVIGMSGFNPRRFLFLNLLSTLIWSALVSALGYFFGHVVQSVLHDLRRYELFILAAMAVSAAAIWHYRYRCKKS